MLKLEDVSTYLSLITFLARKEFNTMTTYENNMPSLPIHMSKMFKPVKS